MGNIVSAIKNDMSRQLVSDPQLGVMPISCSLPSRTLFQKGNILN